MPDDQKMTTYIGCKVVCASPMGEAEFYANEKGQDFTDERPSRQGYLVVYPDGYRSWSPKEQFEQAYRPVSEDEKTFMQ